MRRRGILLGQSALCGVLSLGAYGLVPGTATGEPAGTSVVSGDVTIHVDGKHTEFRQGTPTAILTHDSFNIKADESVHFRQPTANSLAVNKVIGKDLPTTISGKLTANGNVWVLNPSGVAISRGAEVNVNGLIATTANISNDKILSGDRTFTGAPDGSSIVNDGTIRAGTGSVVLVAPTVENTGTITTNGSDVAMGAGTGFTIDMNGDGLTRFEVAPGKDVKITANGAIRTEGGAVYMSAESKDVVREAVVSVGGRVDATRVDEEGGVIYIHGGNGKTEITGTINAAQNVGAGGKIVVTGDLIDIKKTARLDASGATDGGTVHIGGAYRGKSVESPVLRAALAPADVPLPTARATVVERGAEIRVNAGETGDGGEAIVWADDWTAFYGSIEAKGGFLSGDGGLVEVSGKINLSFDGRVDTSAPFGKPGTLLLDPTIVNIVVGPAGANDGELDPGAMPPDLTIGSGDGGNTTFEISDDAIVAALAVGEVSIAATDEINLIGALNLDATGTNTLNLTSEKDLTFAAGSTTAMGDNPLVATAAEDLVVDGGITSTASVTLVSQASNKDLTVNATINAAGAAGAVSLTSGRHVDINAAVTSGGAISMSADQDVDLAAAVTGGGTVSLVADADSSGGGGAGDLIFRAGSSVSGAGVTLNSGENLDMRNVTLTGAGTTLSITTSNDNITQNGATTISAANGVTTVNAGTGNVTLDNANDFGAGGATSHVTVIGGDVEIVDANSVEVRGASADSLIVTGTAGAAGLAGTVNVAGNIAVNAGTDVNIGSSGVATAITTTSNGNITLTPGAVGGNVVFVADGADTSLTADGAVSVTLGTGGFTDTGNGTVSIGTDAVFTFTNFVFDSADLNLTTNGDVTQTNATTVTGALSITTSNDNVVLNEAANDFGSFSAVTTGGGSAPASVQVRDGTGGIVLGAISGTTVVVNSTDGSITDTPGSRIIATGVTSLSAFDENVIADPLDDEFFDIALDNSGAGDLHDLGDGVGDTVSVIGEDVVLRTTDDFLIGTISISANGASDPTIGSGLGDLTLAVVNGVHVVDAALTVPGNLELSAGTDLTASLVIDTTGTTSLIAGGNIVADNIANDFGGTLFIDADANAGQNVTIQDANSIELGTVDVAGNLTVTALGAGDITDFGAGDISVSGTSTFSAGDDILVFGVANTVGGLVTLSADQIVDFTTSGGATYGAVTATNAVALNRVTNNIGGAIDFAGAVMIGAGVGTFEVRSAGNTTQSGGSISTGALLLTAGSPTVTFTLEQSNAVTSLTVVNTSGTPASVSVTDVDGIDLTGGTMGALTLNTGGAVTDSGGVTVTGATSITTTGDAVTLDEATNDFGGAVSVVTTGGGSGAAPVTINDDVAGLTLGEITASTLTITADGTVTDTVTEAISVSGTTSILANDAVAGFSDIVLDNTGAGAHTFTGAVTATGEDISLVTTGAFVIGAITLNADGSADTGTGNIPGATGSLTIRAGGTITQSQALNVPGALDVHSEDLTTAGEFSDVFLNNLNLIGGAISATGEDIQLREVSGTQVTIGTIAANTDGTADPTFDWSGFGVGTGNVNLIVTGATDGTTGSVTADSVVRFFGLGGGDFVFDNEGLHNVAALASFGAVNLTFNNDGALVLGLSAGNGVFYSTAADISAEGSITQVGYVNGGNLTVTAVDDAGTGFFDILLDNGFNSITGELTATGQDISFTNSAVAGLTLGNIRSNAGTDTTINNGNDGDLTLVSTGGTIRDVGGDSIVATGTTSLLAEAGGGDRFDIDLDNVDAHDFSEVASLNATGEDIYIEDVNNVRLGAITTTDNTAGTVDPTFGSGAGDLTVWANGTITDTDGSAITASGSTILIALDNGGTTHNITVDNAAVADVHDFVGTTGVFGATVSLSDANRITLIGGSTATGDLTVRSEDVDITGLVTVGGGTGLLTFLNRGGSFGAGDAFGGGMFGTAYNLTNADVENISAGTVRFEADQPGSSFVSNNFNTTGTDGLADNFAALQIDVNEVIFANANGTDSIVGNLEVETNNFVRQGVGATGDTGTLVVTGSTSILAAPTDVDLNSGTNNFGGVVEITGTGAATLRDINSILLGDIDVTGNMTVTALGGNITDNGDGAAAGDDINIGGVASLSASGNILLDDLFNDFDADSTGDAVDADAAGTSLVLNDASDIVLGEISVTGGLTVTAGGTITDTPGLAISVGGTTSLLAESGGDRFDVVLDNVNLHDFSATSPLNVTGEDIHIDDIDGMLLGAVTPTDNSGGTVDTTIDNDNDGDLTINSGGDILQNGSAIVVPGLATLNSDGGQVLLTGGANNFSTFSLFDPGVTGTARAFTITDVDEIALTNLTATLGDVDVDAPGNVFVLTGTSVRATGNVELTSTTSGAAGALGTASIVADSDSSGAGDVILLANGNDAGGDFTSTIRGASVSITGTSILGGDIVATHGNVSLTSTVTDIVVGFGGTTSISAATSVDATAATNLAFGNLVALTLNGTATGGSISQIAGTTWDVAGVSTLSAATNITLAETGNDFGTVNARAVNVTLYDDDNIVMGDFDVTGNLTVTAEGNITDTGGIFPGAGIDVAGTTSLTALDDLDDGDTSNDVRRDIILTAANNDFGTDSGAADSTINDAITEVDAFGANISLNDADAIQLGAVDASGSLTVTAGGSITDNAGEAIMVVGTTSLLAEAGADRFDVVLDNVNTHNFSDTAPLNVTGEDIHIDDIDGILLGNVTATDNSFGVVDPTIDNGNNGDLLVNSGGDVDQAALTSIIVPGLATLNSDGGSFTLTRTTNDFSGNVFIDEGVTGTASAFTLVDANDIALANLIAAGGGVDVDAPGTVGVIGGTSVTATDNVELTSSGTGLAGAFETSSIVADSDMNGTGDVILLASGNAAGGSFTSTIRGASVSITGTNVSGGDIVSTTGNVSLTATTGSIDVGFGATTTINATTSLDAVAATNIAFGHLVAPTIDLTATAGSISQFTGTAWNVPGITNLSAGTAITLAERGNDFATVNATAVDATLYDADEIVLGDFNLAGNLTVTAEGAITDVGSGTPGAGIEVLGTTSLAAVDDMANADPLDDVLFDITLDDSNHDFGVDFLGAGYMNADAVTEVDARGANIILADVDGIMLGAVSTPGTLSVTAGGSITDTGGKTIAVTGSTSLTAVDDQGNADPTDDNFFDIRIDGVDADASDKPHDFTTVAFLGEDFSIVDVNSLTISGTTTVDGLADPTNGGAGGAVVVNAGSAAADELVLATVNAAGDIDATAFGRFRIGALRSTGGGIFLETTDDNFAIIDTEIPMIFDPLLRLTSAQGSQIPIWANGELVLLAPNGSFILDGEASPAVGVQTRNNAIPEDLLFRSDTSLIEFDFNVGFLVADVTDGPDDRFALTLDAPASAIVITDGDFIIGSNAFIDASEAAGFDPFNTTAEVIDRDLLSVTGEFGLISYGLLKVLIQNTSPSFGSQDGTGAVIDGVTHLGGKFESITLFGTFNGLTGTAAALNGFDFIGPGQSTFGQAYGRFYPDFEPDPDNTVNGCVIGVLSSCQPLGSIIPFLSFEDGRFLSIRFVDPTEDEDDPFSNRGDEEEWE